jgi:hypothetical protein
MKGRRIDGGLRTAYAGLDVENALAVCSSCESLRSCSPALLSGSMPSVVFPPCLHQRNLTSLTIYHPFSTSSDCAVYQSVQLDFRTRRVRSHNSSRESCLSNEFHQPCVQLTQRHLFLAHRVRRRCLAACALQAPVGRRLPIRWPAAGEYVPLVFP